MSTDSPTKASALIQAVYSGHVEHFGDPDDGFRFGPTPVVPGQEHFPPVMDVMVWRPEDEDDVTILATIGMSDRPMPGASHRAELHFAIRGSMSGSEESRMAMFLANLAVFPFRNDTSFNWWHVLADPGAIPCFSQGMSLIFHPRFSEHGLDRIDAEGHAVHLLNVVPVTAEERALLKSAGRQGLCSRWEEEDIDLFARR